MNVSQDTFEHTLHCKESYLGGDRALTQQGSHALLAHVLVSSDFLSEEQENKVSGTENPLLLMTDERVYASTTTLKHRRTCQHARMWHSPCPTVPAQQQWMQPELHPLRGAPTWEGGTAPLAPVNKSVHNTTTTIHSAPPSSATSQLQDAICMMYHLMCVNYLSNLV